MSRFLTSGVCLAAGSLLMFGTLSAHGSDQTLKDKIAKIDQLINNNQNDAAAKLLEDPALDKSPRAYYLRGLIALRKNQIEKAIPLFEEGCKMNDLNCHFVLGVIYKQGFGTPVKPERAFLLLKKLADTIDHPEACRLTGEMLILGEGTAKDEAAGEKYLLKAAGEVDCSKPHSGNAVAQVLLGVFYMEKKDYPKAYKYLEMAGYGGISNGWTNLAVLYSNGHGIEKNQPVWARLCLEAAERIEPSGRIEYDIAMFYITEGDYETGMKWMKKSAASKYQKAIDELKNEQKIKDFKQMASWAQDQKNKQDSGLRNAVNHHFSSLKKLIGTDGREVLAQLNDEVMPQSTNGFLRRKIDKKYYMEQWTFDKQAVSKYIDSRLITRRDGNLCWMTEDFLKSPLECNLLYPNPTIRAINTIYQEKLEAFIKEQKFLFLNEADTEKIVKAVDADDWREDAENSIWKLKENIYLHLMVDFSGRWNLRYYRFLRLQNGKYQIIGAFDTPPDAHQVAAIFGSLDKDPASLNNLAVDMEVGANNSVFNESEDAEILFKMLVDQGHAVAAMNLATFYRNRGNKDLEKKYSDLAGELLKKRSGK